jgi:hypothetical protein
VTGLVGRGHIGEPINAAPAGGSKPTLPADLRRVFLWPRWGMEHLEQGARFQIVGADIR